MQHHVERARGLPSDGVVVPAGECAERLEAGGNIRETVRMQGSGTSVVAGVERRQQVADLLAAALPTTIRSGRMRRLSRTSRASPIAPAPSRFACLASSATWCG